MQISLQVPQYISQSMTQADIEHQFKLSFVIDQYRQGNLTLKQASQWVALGEIAFLEQCQKRGVSRQTYADNDELSQEFAKINRLLAKQQGDMA